MEHIPRPAHGARFEGRAAREHQHHQNPGQIFPQHHAGDDGQPGQQIGAERAGKQLLEQPPHQRHAPQQEHRHQWQVAQAEPPPGQPAGGAGSHSPQIFVGQ